MIERACNTTIVPDGDLLSMPPISLVQGTGSSGAVAEAVGLSRILIEGSGTDADAEEHVGRIDAPYWADRTDLEGMGIAVQRAKRMASEVIEGVTFSEPVVEHLVLDEDDPSMVLVSVEVLLPTASDANAFRDEFFDGLARELNGNDLGRLAIGVRVAS